MAETEELLVEKIHKWKQCMEENGLRVNVGKTKVMRQDLDPHETFEGGHVEFAGMALVQVVLSAINAVCGFMEGIVVYLVNYRIQLVSDARDVLMGSCFEKL